MNMNFKGIPNAYETNFKSLYNIKFKIFEITIKLPTYLINNNDQIKDRKWVHYFYSLLNKNVLN